MKKYMLFIMFVLTTACYSQIIVSPEYWSSATDTSAFDGVSRVALIVGTSDIVGSPMLSVNRTDGENIKVYLSYWPAGICGPTNLTIKFGDEKTFYDVSAVYSTTYRRYVVQFNDRLTIDNFIQKCKTLKKFYIRMTSRCVTMDVEFTLEGAPEALEILQ